MTIKTFNANKVGGGTFQLEQDPLTGEYKVKEVGFVKLPELKLPEIEQAAPVTPDPDPSPDPSPDPGTGSGSGGSGGGGSDRQDFTGESMYKNIQQEAAGGDLMKQATQVSSALDRTDIDQGGIQVENLMSSEKKAYDKAVASYNAIAERNRDLAMGRQPVSEEDSIQNKVDIDAARNEMDAARKNYEETFETIKAAPVISEDLQKFGPRTVTDISQPFRSESEKFKTRFDPTKIEAAPEKKNTLGNTVKKIVDNSLVVNVAKAGVKILDAITPDLTTTQQVNNRLFKTAGDLGSSTDPGRIVGNPATDLYAGMNRNSAFGNLERAGNKRIATREATIARKGIKSASNPNGVSQDFVDNTNNMKDQSSRYKAEKQKATQGPAGGATTDSASGGDKGSDSGKIVCTMMNERYGFGSFRNKIWLKFHKDYSPEYQKGYHKVFLPLVNIAKKEGVFNTIVRKILEHMGRHVTADMFQVMRNKKSDKLGRIYRKIFEPICYWLGGK
jgi:hypothetical protein